MRSILAAAVLCSAGLPSAALQLAAWGRMALTSERPFAQAFAEAVSGVDPCGICLTVSRAVEKESLRAPAASPTELFPPQPHSLFVAVIVLPVLAFAAASGMPPWTGAPTPPPQSLG
jgi:hypothetical protein